MLYFLTPAGGRRWPSYRSVSSTESTSTLPVTMSSSSCVPRLSTPIIPNSLSRLSVTTLWTLGNFQRKRLYVVLTFLYFFVSTHLTNHVSRAQLLFEPNPELTAGRSWSVEGHTPQPNGYTRGPSRCYNDQGKAQRCVPPFVNAAFNQLVEATNTCGNPPIEYCRQTGVTC